MFVTYADLRAKLKEVLEYWNSDIRDEDVSDFPQYYLSYAISKSNSFKLYRYMPTEYYNIRNLETQIIHLSCNGKMNDVFEGLPETSDEVSQSKLKRLEDLALMVCMSECNNSNLMWSHYARNHEGICVEYDLKRLENDPHKILNNLFPIVYRNQRHIIRNIDSLVDSHLALNKAIAEHYEYDGNECLDDILPLFLTKSLDWEYEKEWRIVYTKKQMYDVDEKELYDGNLKFECISAVYLGYRIDPTKKTHILEICGRFNENGQNVSVYQSKLSKTSYDIEFEKLL